MQGEVVTFSEYVFLLLFLSHIYHSYFWFPYSPLYEISKFQRNSCSFPYLIQNQTFPQNIYQDLYLTKIVEAELVLSGSFI